MARKKYIRIAERKRRAAISSGLRIYWSNIKRASHATNLSLPQLRKKFSKSSNVSKKGNTKFWSAVRKQQIKAGKRNTYTVVWTAQTAKKKYISTIKGLFAKNKKDLQNLIGQAIQQDLRARGLILERYVSQFSRAIKANPRRFQVIKDFRFIIQKEEVKNEVINTGLGRVITNRKRVSKRRRKVKSRRNKS